MIVRLRLRSSHNTLPHLHRDRSRGRDTSLGRDKRSHLRAVLSATFVTLSQRVFDRVLIRSTQIQSRYSAGIGPLCSFFSCYPLGRQFVIAASQR